MPNHVVSDVVTHAHLLNPPEPARLDVHILEEVIELLVSLEPHVFRDRGLGDSSLLLRHVVVVVHVLEDYGLGEGWGVVLAGAPVAVSASTDLKVEWAVDLILFREIGRG